MKRIKNIFIFLVVVIFMLVPKSVEAASQKTAALTSYAKFLANPNNQIRIYNSICLTKNCYFEIAYIDNNNVPELVLYTPDSCHVSGFGVLYTYRNGKMQKVSPLHLDKRSTLGYYSKKGILKDNYSVTGMSKDFYDRLSGTSLKAIAYKNLKKYVGKTKLKKFKFYKNTATNRKKYLGITGSTSVAVSRVSLNQKSLTITKGKMYILNVTISPSTATNKSVSWSSSNRSVASVSGGRVTALKAGTAKITAKTSNGKYASCTVTVKNPAPAYTPCISLSKRISSGSSSGRIDVTAFPCGAVINWYSSNSNVVSVDSFGNITARGKGIATITASMCVNGKTYSQSTNITVGGRENYGSWSSWTTDPISGTAYTQVDTATVYRYYCFYCPVCGGREPFQGISDCHKYTLTLSDARVMWSPVPYYQSNPKGYCYTTAKYYTESLGDGLRWNFSAGNLNQTSIGTVDAAGPSAVVITRGYRSRSVSYTNYFI